MIPLLLARLGGAAVAGELLSAGTATRALGAEASRSSAVLERMRAGLGSLTPALQDMAVSGVKAGLAYNATMESAERSLGVQLGSVGRARSLLATLGRGTVGAPGGPQHVATLARQMVGMGMGARQTASALRATNTAALATGGNAASFEQTALALAAIKANGHASARELSQLTAAGVPVNELLREELGLTSEQIAGLGESGIAADKVIGAVTRGMQKHFGAAARGARDDWNVQLTQMRSNVLELQGVVARPLFSALGSALPTINRVLAAGVDGARRGGLGGMFAGFGRAILGESRWDAVGQAAGRLWRTIRSGLGLTSRDFRRAFEAMRNVGRVVFAVLRVGFAVWLAVARKSIAGIQQAFRGLLRIIGGVVKVVSGILTGNFGAALDGMKQIASGTIDFLIGTFKRLTAPARVALEGIWKGLGKAASAAFGGVKSVLLGVLNWVIDKINVVIEGINGLSFDTPFGRVGVHIDPLAHIGEGGAGQSRPGAAGLYKFPRSGVIEQDGTVTPVKPQARTASRTLTDLTVNMNLDGRLVGRANTRYVENRETFA